MKKVIEIGIVLMVLGFIAYIYIEHRGGPAMGAKATTDNVASTNPSPSSNMSAQATTLSGVIMSLDASQNKLSIKDKEGKVHIYEIKPGTLLTSGKKDHKITVASLKHGEKVSLELNGQFVEKLHVDSNAAKRTHLAKARKSATNS